MRTGDSLATLVSIVDEAMLRSAPLPFVIDFTILDALVWALAQPTNFTKLVQTILSDETLLESVVRSSYHHDLFDKTVLLQAITI